LQHAPGRVAQDVERATGDGGPPPNASCGI
jgi:hypothetical protein